MNIAIIYKPFTTHSTIYNRQSIFFLYTEIYKMMTDMEDMYLQW